MRFICLTDWATTLWLKDDPMSTSFASTEWITTGFLKQFSTGMANSIFDKWHTSKVIDMKLKTNKTNKSNNEAPKLLENWTS